MVVRVRVPETFFLPLRLGLGARFASLFLSNVVVTQKQKLQIAQCWCTFNEKDGFYRSEAPGLYRFVSALWRMDSIVYVETTQ